MIKDDKHREPYNFYINEEGKIRVFANGFIDATNKAFIEYIDNHFYINSIEEIRDLVSTQNWEIISSDSSDDNTKIIGIIIIVRETIIFVKELISLIFNL